MLLLIMSKSENQNQNRVYDAETNTYKPVNVKENDETKVQEKKVKRDARGNIITEDTETKTESTR
jgi:hypothetical protein